MEAQKNDPILKIENISKSFGRGSSVVKAVCNVSFTIETGEIVLIMGPSGSGKTTLISIIGSLLTADYGTVSFGEMKITSLPKTQLPKIRAKQIGFIFQSFNLLTSLNAWENVAIAMELAGFPSHIAKEKAQFTLKKLGLAERLNYPIADLSGGEQQKVSIARAVTTDPQIILADEPTANLDIESGYEVMELLKKIAKQERKIVLVVTHDLRLLKIADRILWMTDGKIKEGKEKIVIDPICDMPLQKNHAPYHVQKGNQTYYFCSQKCRQQFLEMKTLWSKDHSI